MKLRSTKLRLSVLNILAGSSLLAIASAAGAQTPSGGDATATSSASLEEIIVTARRKEESVQDVPSTINVVTGAELAALNIRNFTDIATVVPGLAMATNQNGIGATASVRGVNYDVNASGNNGTVEFYMNDAPISPGNLFQTMYDFQQVELLRGPQGTLRGRASPSGSMTVTTRRPDMSEIGGYVSATGTDIGGYNGQGAFSFPIISDKLAVRLAGAYDKNEGTRVKSIHNSADPSSETSSGRATVSFEPIDSLSFVATYQKTTQDIVAFDQVESQQVLSPATPVTLGAPGALTPPAFIKATDRLSVEDAPRNIKQEFENINLQAQWSFAGQRINYVGARNEQTFDSFEVLDVGDFFPTNYPAYLSGYGQATDTGSVNKAHELRLSSEERIAGIFDYIVGAFYQKQTSPTSLTLPTPVLFAPPSPAVPGLINNTAIARDGTTLEESVFANLTAQLGDSVEVSGGVRYIEFDNQGALYVNGVRNPGADQDAKDYATIYSLSVKYKISDDFMVYGSTGTSWRPGATAIGDFSLVRTPLENSFIVLEPEESTSYEVGFKATGLDGRLRGAFSVFHQTFDNYPYRSAGGVYFVETTAINTPPPNTERVRPFNFVAAVPVEVNGVEAEITYAPFTSWDMGAVAAYSKGEIKDGFVPCNDYSPRDGIPDGPAAPPTVAQIRTATGGDNISGCTVTQRSSLAPLWSASLKSEYRVAFSSGLTGFVSGLLSLYGDSENDPTNTVDDYGSYELLNLYVGLRGEDGKWEVSLYGKNVTETEQVLTRSGSTMSTTYQIGAAGQSGATNYYGGTATTGLLMTAPREIGLNVRWSFGSR